MKMKKNLYLKLIFIFILVFFAFPTIFPGYFNRSIDYLNRKFNNFQIIKKLKIVLPYFPNIPFRLGLDLQGGTYLTYQADLSKIKIKERKESMEGLRDIIERRINVFGVREPYIAIQKVKDDFRLIVELPGVKDIQQAIKMIGKTPYLEFREERSQKETEEILKKQKEFAKKSPFQYQNQKIEKWRLAFEDPYFKPTELTGKYLKKARLDFDKNTFEPQVVLEFNSQGAKIFKQLTEKNIGRKLAIYIDNVIISAPVVREIISGGKAQITGRFTVEQAKELVRNLNAGALPFPIKLISQTTIGPTLGTISLKSSLKAGLFGFLGICLFMIIFYRLCGFFACLALIIYGAIILSLFKIIPVTLTLAGIGGVILSVGMAVDANVLIFERLKEELKKGENFSRALIIGFSRAWPSIRDSNLTTLIVSLIMFSFGTSFVKGFALTLSLGILVSLFSAIFVTRTFLMFLIGSKLEKRKWILL